MKVSIGKYKNKGRKISVQIDDSDVWSFDHTLAYIILPALLQLKKVKHGIPNDFAEVGGANHESQYCFDFYSESHNEAFDEGVKRWDEVLNKMIWSFQQLIIEYEDKYHYGKFKFDWEESTETYKNSKTGKLEKLFQMIDKTPNEHWTDFVGMELHNSRIQEGLDLFGKYYRSLWD